MKTITLLSLVFVGVAFADFEKWTNKDGKTADLNLIQVVEVDGEKAGEFMLRNGSTITLKASALSAEAAEKINTWAPPAPVAEVKPSVFDKILDGNLVRLEGRSFKKFDFEQKPKKYFVFYYTASWCGPCQAYTPSLVEFYERKKNDNFEIVLITSDQDENAMEQYAKEKKMPWPLLKLRKAEDFKQTFKHGVTGIPSVIVCNPEGEVLGNYRDLAALGKLVE